MAPRVVVIGAGPLGLMALKNFLETGFDVTCFESRDYVGGLWKDTDDSQISALPLTTFNSSKYRAAISDFPFLDTDDDFPTAPQLQRYLNDYCDHFDLRRHIQLSTPAKSLKRIGDKWQLEVAPKDGHPRFEIFDKVAFATGSFFSPKRPTIEGVEKFEGPVLHSIDYHQYHSEELKGKNVLILGIHATAQDVTHSLSGNASKVYLSHKNPVTVLPRYGPDGAAFDLTAPLAFVFFQTFMTTYFPRIFNWLLDTILTRMSKKAYPNHPKSWNLTPGPSIAVSVPLVVSTLDKHLDSGFATPVGAVSKVTGPKSVLLADGTTLPDISAIITCTGYDFNLPFAPKEYNPYPVVGEAPLLYRNTFPMSSDLFLNNSLAFLGQAAVALPGFSQHELISMAVAQIWIGKEKLPSHEEMKAWYDYNAADRRAAQERNGSYPTHYPVLVPFADHMRWLDKTAGTGIYEHYGWFKWRAWRFWWQDRELYKKTLGGLLTPSIWRLFDMGKRKPWSGAKSQIYADNESADRQRKRGAEMVKKQAEEKKKA